jgi:hypothetical protein
MRSAVVALAALCISLLACGASASRPELLSLIHTRASVRRLHGNAADLTTVDKCTFKQDFFKGVGTCIPNQLYLFSQLKFDMAYGLADMCAPSRGAGRMHRRRAVQCTSRALSVRYQTMPVQPPPRPPAHPPPLPSPRRLMLNETAMQLQCLSHGPGAKCRADRDCSDFKAYCGYTPSLAAYTSETSNSSVWRLNVAEHEMGFCRPTCQTVAECQGWVLAGRVECTSARRVLQRGILGPPAAAKPPPRGRPRPCPCPCCCCRCKRRPRAQPHGGAALARSPT